MQINKIPCNFNILVFDNTNQNHDFFIKQLSNFCLFFASSFEELKLYLNNHEISLILFNNLNFDTDIINKILELKNEKLLEDTFLLFLVEKYNFDTLKTGFQFGLSDYLLLSVASEILNEKINQIMSVAIQIRELKKYYQEAESILSSIPDFYYRVKLDGTILDYKTNNSLYLYKNEEVILQKNIKDLFPSSIASGIIRMVQLVNHSGSSMSSEFLVKRNYRREYYDTRFFPHDDLDEVSIFLRDVTDKELANEEKINKEKMICFQKTINSVYKGINDSLSFITGTVQVLKLNINNDLIEDKLLLIEENAANIELILKRLSELEKGII